MTERLTSARYLAYATWIGSVASLVGMLAGLAPWGPALGATLATAPPIVASPAPVPLVWYNRQSAVYHLSTCQYFLRTVDGVQVSLVEASKLGKACAKCFGPGRRTVVIRGARGEKRDGVLVLP